MIEVPTKLLTPTANYPSYGSDDAAGADLYADLEGGHSMTSVMLDPGERMLVKTGVAMAIPKGWYGRVAPRSGLAYKHGIDVLAGVIDADYRGEVAAILINLGDQPFLIQHGDRIAQMVFTPFGSADIRATKSLPDSVRGEAGYGSTGR